METIFRILALLGSALGVWNAALAIRDRKPRVKVFLRLQPSGGKRRSLVVRALNAGTRPVAVDALGATFEETGESVSADLDENGNFLRLPCRLDVGATVGGVVRDFAPEEQVLRLKPRGWCRAADGAVFRGKRLRDAP